MKQPYTITKTGKLLTSSDLIPHNIRIQMTEIFKKLIKEELKPSISLYDELTWNDIVK